MKKKIFVSLILILVLLASVVPFSGVAGDGDPCPGTPAKPIANGLLYPFVPECQKFIRYHPTSYSQPVAHVPIPQHPYMAQDVANNMHCDAYISDTQEESGPLGINLEIKSRTQGFGGYGTIAYDKAKRLVAVYSNGNGYQLELLDPNTLAELASYDLPPRPWYSIFQGVVPWEYLGAGIYFYLDEQDQAVVPTTQNAIKIIQVPEGCGEFTLEREYDLSDYVVPMCWPQEDSVAWVLPDWSGEYYWYATTQGMVGTVNVDTGTIQTHRLEGGEIIENSFAVGEEGAYILSDYAFYRFSQVSGNITVDWRTEYDRGPAAKKGLITRGSGTSVTLMGTPENGLAVITDNAEPQIHLQFINRSNGTKMCEQELFGAGKSATDLTTIGFERADENGDGTGVFSVVVENNWGNNIFPRSNPEPGLTRVDATRQTDGTYTCEEIWASNEKGIGGFKLSFDNGLVYMYRRGDPGLITKWYFTAIDFATGETVYKKLTGTGLGYNNWSGGVFLHPDGMAYSTTIFGMVMMGDTGS